MSDDEPKIALTVKIPTSVRSASQEAAQHHKLTYTEWVIQAMQEKLAREQEAQLETVFFPRFLAQMEAVTHKALDDRLVQLERRLIAEVRRQCADLLTQLTGSQVALTDELELMVIELVAKAIGQAAFAHKKLDYWLDSQQEGSAKAAMHAIAPRVNELVRQRMHPDRVAELKASLLPPPQEVPDAGP